jgi:hypothetical protein
MTAYEKSHRPSNNGTERLTSSISQGGSEQYSLSLLYVIFAQVSIDVAKLRMDIMG